jgi:hypothetical protein
MLYFKYCDAYRISALLLKTYHKKQEILENGLKLET